MSRGPGGTSREGGRRDGAQAVNGRRGTTLGAFCIGAVCSVAAAALLKGRPPGGLERWTRKSHAGRPVTVFEGPAYAVGAVAGALAGGAGAPAAVAGLGAGAFGALDDLVGDSSSKGLRGHLAAACRGEVTTGAIKVVGLGSTGLLTAWIVDRSRMRNGALATLVGGAVIAGSANISNLLDLRPGRALKVVLLLAAPIVAGGRATGLSAATATATATAAAAAGAAMGALPGDLAGRSMLGDTGANSAGALLGTALVARTGPRGRLLALAVVTALTLASEKVSFTKVIESTPGLRELDALGRPALPPAMIPL
jgi:UDP-N-acetylmuramyl pentapeptide phosphotransferase/UDP-N-acetylglucosamine-1-phosphate transferase